MPIFKIFPVLTNKIRKASQQTLKKAGQRSVDWFRDRVQKSFGRSRTDQAGTFSKKELEAQQQAINQERARDLPKTQHRVQKPKTPEREIAAGNRQRNQVAANDPDKLVLNKNAQINKQLRQNTTLDAEFKKNLKNTKRPLIGHMYFYIYDPKWKKILPYYDVFPLVIPLDYYDNGFLGMNLHYLPYILRAKLLDFLFSLQHSQTVGGKEQKYMAVSYGVLKGLAGSSGYEPTIKRYLYSHVRSPFAEVLSDEWENAAFLPVEQFRKANKREVWADSRQRV